MYVLNAFGVQNFKESFFFMWNFDFDWFRMPIWFLQAFICIAIRPSKQRLTRYAWLLSWRIGKMQLNVWMHHHHWNSLVWDAICWSESSRVRGAILSKKSWEEKEEGALRDSALLPRLLSFIKGSIKGRRLFTSEFGLVLKWSFRIWIPLRP